MRSVATVVLSFSLLLPATIPVIAADDNHKEGLVLGVFLGPAIPSENIANVYDVLENNLGDAYDYAASLGYTVGGKVRIGLSSSFSVSGGLSFVQFPAQDLRLTDSLGRVYALKSTTNVVPVQAGLTWLPFRSTVAPYIGGHVMYTYRNTTISNGNLVEDIFSPGQQVDPTRNSFGASVNAGLEFALGVHPFIDVSYMWPNLTGRMEGEVVKTFVTITIGLIL